MTDFYQLPLLTPDSDWRPPTELPDLRGRSLVAIDTEERDDGLSQGRGPGWATRSGRIIGFSYAAEGAQGYVPLAHPDTECWDRDAAIRWLRDLVRSGTRLVFQNAPYDLGWLWADLGVEIPAEYPLEDALAAAFMINEDEYEYNLDAICRRLGIPGKDERLLTEAAAAYLRPANAKRSWKLTKKELKSNMWRMPARYVGPYAETDAVRTLEAFRLLEPTLHDQELTEAYRLEMDLVPTVRQMRARGIRIDEEATYTHRDSFRAKRDEALAEIHRRSPGRGNPSIDNLRQLKWLEQTFDAEGIRDIPRTDPSRAHAEGVSSFKQDWMERHAHPLPKLVARALQCDRMAEVFLGTFILGFTHKGRLHAEIHQYKSDDGGTVSYRFSYSQPPLQQAPSPDMDPEFGLPFREVFVADGIWGANDYSQQEYRLTAHFAALCGVRGGEEAAAQFHADPKLDFHTMVANLTGLHRSKAKIQNFALLYGQGLAATAAKLGVTEDEATELRDKVAEKAPFGPALDEYCKQRAARVGYLRLLDGARVRFDEWEAGWVAREEYQRGLTEHRPMTPCSLEDARARKADPEHPWHNAKLRRAGVRKALNRLIQGSAARQTKLAMRECAREGLVPILQMHDELDHDEDSEAKIHRVAEIMRHVVPLRVPMKVDTGTGPSWAAAKAKDDKKEATVVVMPGVRAETDVTNAASSDHRQSRLEKVINTYK